MAYTTINKSSDYFNTKLYNGTGSSNAVTGVGFQPDFTWIKRRNSATNHHLHNAISGATKVLYSNSTGAESTDAQKLSSFDSDGFTVGTNGDANNSSGTFVSWNWLGNGAGSANTDGSINSTVSVSTAGGFSIVKWTGSNANATIGHGLGAVPKMIVFKNLATATSWMVYHVTQGATKFLRFNTTDAVGTGSTPFNDTAPTSSVFSVGANGDTNGSSQAMIAYCFTDKIGYSKFGEYTGNGNANGPFVYTGFKPTFVMVKEYANAGRAWVINDNKRDPFNQCTNGILVNTNGAESTGYNFDHLSNGFKPRTTGSGENASGFKYLYMAFGQSIVGSNNIPATAR